MELLRNYAEQQLLQGHIVTIPHFGTLRITFKSNGVEDINDFNANTMIKEPRLLFTPTKEFRESVINSLTFENAGVLEDGISYASLADYRKAVASGSSAGSGSGSTDDSGDDSSEDNPLV